MTLTMTHYGLFEVSGAALKTKVDAIASITGNMSSGAGLYFVPVANGERIAVITVANA